VTFALNEEFNAALGGLIDSLCERRALGPLAKILPGYVAFNGLTDGWADLRSALRAAIADSSVTDAERQVLNDLARAADRALSR
jgi:hypothetical protein